MILTEGRGISSSSFMPNVAINHALGYLCEPFLTNSSHLG